MISFAYTNYSYCLMLSIARPGSPLCDFTVHAVVVVPLKSVCCSW